MKNILLLMIACITVFFLFKMKPQRAMHENNEVILKRVVYLLNETVIDAKREADAFRELEKMGEAAVPYLIKNLADMRPLAQPEITLRNLEGNFEENRFYSPILVHDGIEAVLNQITGVHFGKGIGMNSMAERAENRLRWIAWCSEKYKNASSICGSHQEN